MDRSSDQTALLPTSQALDSAPSVPVVLERAGQKALFAADDFFSAWISNPHTRRAYASKSLKSWYGADPPFALEWLRTDRHSRNTQRGPK